MAYHHRIRAVHPSSCLSVMGHYVTVMYNVITAPQDYGPINYSSIQWVAMIYLEHP